jgi:hypothetical protein
VPVFRKDHAQDTDWTPDRFLQRALAADGSLDSAPHLQALPVSSERKSLYQGLVGALYRIRYYDSFLTFG